MNILIFNGGSSSQGFKVYQTAGNGQPPVVLASGKARNVATATQAQATVEWNIAGQAGSRSADLSTHRKAAQQIIAVLQAHGVAVDAIGHRFLHGGNLFERSTRIEPDTLERLQQCFHFAPIHNPNAYRVIEVCLEQYPGLPQVAVFDTLFHAGLPEASKQYAIPRPLAEKYGLRKYGFHGLSYQYVSARTAELLGQPLEALKLILCHLGTGGSSVVAVKDGRSLDTSMGYTPLPGLIMSTRCGDIDAEVVLELVRSGHTPDEVSQILNHQSGLVALSGYSSNLQEIIAAAESGDARCQLAYDAYAQRLKEYIGAYTWLLNGADAIVFTDDLGVKSWQLRERVFSGAQALGVELDLAANRQAPAGQPACISAPGSKTRIWTVPTDEEIVILNEALARL